MVSVTIKLVWFDGMAMAICLVVSTYWDNYWDNHWDLLATVVIYWLVVSTYPSEKYEFVSWDDDIPNIWKVIKMFQTTNQL